MTTTITVHVDEIAVSPVAHREPFTFAEARATDDVYVSTTAIVAVMPSRRIVVLECEGAECALCHAGRPAAVLAWEEEPFSHSRFSPDSVARDLIRAAVAHLEENRAQRARR